MFSAEATEKATHLLAGARRGRYQLAALPDGCVPKSVDEAYLIQDGLAELLDKRVGGWFLGCTNDEALERLSAAGPYSARLFAEDIFVSPMTFAPNTFFTSWIDCEFAFRLNRDLPPRAAAYGENEVLDAIESVHGAIEIVNGYLEQWQRQPIGAIMADNGTDGALIFAKGVASWRQLDLEGLEVNLSVNGQHVKYGRGEDVLGSPLNTLVWLANEQSRRGWGLRAGMINNTGSCTVPHEVFSGDSAIADYGPLGSVHVVFE